MNLREIFRKIGMRYTKAYFVNEYLYLVPYIIARGIWIPCIYYITTTCDVVGIVTQVLYPLHLAQNFFYVKQMFTLLNQRISEQTKIAKLGMKMSWTESLPEEELAKHGIKHFNNFKA